MNLLPGPAQFFQVIQQDGHHAPDLPLGESIILPDFCRPYRTIQIEYCFAPSIDYVNMRWSMIVWINHNPQSVNPQNRRHYNHSSNIPKRLGLRLEIKP